MTATVAAATAEPTTTAPVPNPLTAHDRCDRCGAQAYTSWRSVSEQILLFCAHHANKFEINLELKGFKVYVDNRPMLLAQESDQRDAGSAV